MSRRFAHRLRGSGGGFDGRIAAWRDLSIPTAALVNPYLDIENPVSIPLSPQINYFPGETIAAEVPGGGGCTIDVIDVDAPADARNSMMAAYRSLKDAAAARLRADEEEHKRGFYDAANDMKHAARFLIRDCKYEPALRAFLNVRRMGDRDPHTGRWLAMCLAEVGSLAEAGFCFALAAQGFEKSNKLAEAADCYERAGLTWEALYGRKRRPESGLGDDRRDSTGCLRSAKSYFTLLGEYDEASRCYVLERDAHARWTWSRARRAELATMRWLWLYGESPFHALRAIGVLWIACALAFLYAGFESSGQTIDYAFAPELHLQGLLDFAAGLYFSAVTMSTLGYGDCAPASGVSRLLSGFEAFAGVCLLAMFLVSVQRRYVGR